MYPITQIVLTGGPCAGKSEATSHLVSHLSSRGYRVLTCPEIATLLIVNAAPDISDLAANHPHKYLGVETQLLSLQISMREHFQRLAEVFAKDQPVVIIYDRAEMDIAAYVEDHQWQTMCESAGVDEQSICSTYDAVLHLETAAKGQASHYTTKNNSARRESASEAVVMCDRTLAMWESHHNLSVIAPAATFAEKLSKVLSAATQAAAGSEIAQAA